jgi:hypothetical protein
MTEQDRSVLDHWAHSWQPSVGQFNHAVDVANALHRENQRLTAALAASPTVAQREQALVAAEQAGYEHANGVPVPSSRLTEARRLLGLADQR